MDDIIDTIELVHQQMGASDYQMRVSNVSNDDGRPGLNGFFLEEDLVIFLMEKDMKNLKNTSPFIGAIVDRICGKAKKSL